MSTRSASRRRATATMPLVVCLLLAALVRGTAAHEARPAYLEVTETARGRYDVVWRTPVLAGMRLPVRLELPGDVRDVAEPLVRELSDSLVERRRLEAVSGTLSGARIRFAGLEATITDVLVRVQLGDGTTSTTLVRPSQPWVDVAARSGALAVMGAYFVHGVEHILFGYDHLLFVFALILIVRSGRILLWTITAFTVAHSITLALATLGLVDVPGPPVEAAIAASILLLAVEIVHLERGRVGLTVRWPWVVAFAFGLLHGFGFAGALADVGLPQGDIPLALLSFNAGVECGQLLFVAAVLGATAVLRRVATAAYVERHARQLASYGIGTLAAFWLFERLAGF
jgi:hydrogenase/urease accessory protein HupE